MAKQGEDSGNVKLGDKVRIRTGSLTGVRGIITAQVNGQLEIETTDRGAVVVEVDAVTNYSLAARKAWQSMPKRAGRPHSLHPRKLMISVRVDPALWDRLGEAVAKGIVSSREEAVNSWLRDRLDAEFRERMNHDKPNQ